ncbi:phosphoglycerate mutase family protein, partial [Dysgonomonas sp. Marseille-P4677]|nr:phosphoglycerate mutase family protein [Dysgonomonas sp. Marseille-P4677]
MSNFLDIAAINQEKAKVIIKDLDIVANWESIGAKINMVGSCKMGLLMKHRDIDFHIYSDTLNIGDSFSVISKLSLNSKIKRIEYTNLIETDEACLEWHAWYQSSDNELWQIDMIHIL